MNKLLAYIILSLSTISLSAQYVSTTQSEINTPWLGFGYNQWAYSRQSNGDSYQPWGEQEWQITKDRILAIKPALVRLPLLLEWFTKTDDGVALPNGVYNKDGKYMQAFFKSMDLYKEHDIPVLTGFWNWVYNKDKHDFYVGTGEGSFAQIQADLIDYLINDKGYTNIKYYTPENEPLGYMSNYSLWNQMIKSLHKVMKEKNLPDILIGADSWGDWKWYPAKENKNELIGYDYHNYLNSSSDDVYNQMYSRSLETFLSNSIGSIRNHDSANKPIMVTEMAPISVQFVDWPIADAPPYCRLETYEYGLGYWDYGIQLMRSGISSGLSWGLDGFQMNKNAGMWNNSGNYGGWYLRPWYYTWQLMCRYFPAHAKVLKMSEPNGGKDVRIAAAKINTDDYTFVAINRRTSVDSKTQTITFKATSSQKTFYVYHYDRTNKGDGVSLSLPYTKVTNVNLSEGITVEIPLETGVLVTSLPPLEEKSITSTESLLIDFESQTGYELLADPSMGVQTNKADNPRAQENNLSDKVWIITQAFPSDVFQNPNASCAIIKPIETLKITAAQAYIDLQCFRSGTGTEPVIGVKFIGEKEIYGSRFTYKNRTWSDIRLDLSAHVGKHIDYIVVYPNTKFADITDETTLQYLYLDNIKNSNEAEGALSLSIIDIAEKEDILTNFDINFESLTETILPATFNDCGSAEIVNNPRADAENGSDKSLAITQFVSKSHLAESNDFSVSLNPLYGVRVSPELNHLHFQFYKMNSLAEIRIKVDFESGEVVNHSVMPDKTRAWTSYSVDLSANENKIIKNITFYPNSKFHSSNPQYDQITFIDNIVLKNLPVASGIEYTNNAPFNLYTLGNKICIEGAFGKKIDLFNLQGVLLRSMLIDSDIFEFVMPSNFYIAKIDQYSRKIIIQQ